MGSGYEMRSVSKTWLALLVLVAVGAVTRVSLPARRILPTTRVLASFPLQLGSYVGRDLEFDDSETTRETYAPAAIVYRNYSNGKEAPITLFIAPEPVGNESPSICAAYSSSGAASTSVTAAGNVPGLRLSQITTRLAGSPGDIRFCSYYWRTPSGIVNDEPIAFLKGKLEMASKVGEPSFRVEMCRWSDKESDAYGIWSQLNNFATLVDPVVNRLLRTALQTGK